MVQAFGQTLRNMRLSAERNGERRLLAETGLITTFEVQIEVCVAEVLLLLLVPRETGKGEG